MYKACIFDLDGTLTDTLASLTYSVNETLKEMKLTEITSSQCREFVGNGARYLMTKALEVSGDRELIRIEEAMERYGRIFGANCTYHVEAYEGIKEMLNELTRQGVQLAVLSNKPHLQTVQVVETIFGKDRFSYILGQKDEVPRKPDPAGIFFLLNQMKIVASECLYIGDSDVDMVTGNAAKVKTVGAEWGFRSKKILMDAGAQYTIEQPEKLLELCMTDKNKK